MEVWYVESTVASPFVLNRFPVHAGFETFPQSACSALIAVCFVHRTLIGLGPAALADVVPIASN